MIHELGPASRALLDAARRDLAPDPAAIARMRAKIDAAVLGTAPATTSAATPTPSTSTPTPVTAKTVATSGAVKLGVVAVAVALVTGALLLARRDAVPIAPPALAPVALTEPAPPPPRIVREELPAPAPAVDAAHERREPRVPRDVRAPRTAIDLGREVELIDRAMAAMRAGDPSAALAAVRVHARETAGTGQLAEDAAAIEIEALCRLHDRSVATRLAAFDARWPDSAQRSRLSTSCP